MKLEFIQNLFNRKSMARGKIFLFSGLFLGNGYYAGLLGGHFYHLMGQSDAPLSHKVVVASLGAAFSLVAVGSFGMASSEVFKLKKKAGLKRLNQNIRSLHKEQKGILNCLELSNLKISQIETDRDETLKFLERIDFERDEGLMTREQYLSIISKIEPCLGSSVFALQIVTDAYNSVLGLESQPDVLRLYNPKFLDSADFD